ncbi:CBS domain-containing protein [Actinoallomurus acanthiterrae]
MHTQVKDVMTTDVVAVEEETPFKQIVEIMCRGKVNSVPVLDMTGQVRGVVSKSDLLFKEADPTATEDIHLMPGRLREQRKAEAVTAAKLMTAPPITVSASATIQDAARTMHERKVGRLPVIDPATGRLVGIVGRADVLSAYRRPDADIRRDVFHEVVARELPLDRGRIKIIVEDGRVTAEGHVTRRSQIPVLLHAVRQVEGVVSANARLAYDVDDMFVGAVPSM